MVVVGYWSNNELMMDSRGGQVWNSKLGDVLAFLMDPHESPAQYQETYKVCWDVDSLAIPLCQLLPDWALKQLATTEAVQIEVEGIPYRIWYPRQDGIGQALAISDRSKPYGERDETIIWPLTSLTPDGIEPPKNPEEAEDYGSRILDIFAKKVGYQPQPKFLFSPVNMLKPYLRRMNLPPLVDLPSKVANFAAQCQTAPWVEAHQLGYWDKVWDVDLSNAYAGILRDMPDWRVGQWFESNTLQTKAMLGYANCNIDIKLNATVHPILIDLQAGAASLVGPAKDVWLTKAQIDFINRWKIGTVQINEGVWWFPAEGKTIRRPLATVIDRLVRARDNMSKLGNPVNQALGRYLAKKCLVGLWGYCAKWDWEGGRKPDEFYNPVWATEIRTRTSLKVAELIYRKKLTGHILHVALDGFLCDCDPLLDEQDTGWKVSGTGPALILSQNHSWFGDKRPAGRALAEVMEMIHQRPKNFSWSWSWTRTATLGDCMMRDENFGLLGREIPCQSTIHLKQDLNRLFPSTPSTGKSLVSRKWKSRPLETDRVSGLTG